MNFKRLSLIEKKQLYKKAKDAYYNTGETIMSDAEFDELEDMIREEAPNWVGLKKAGAKIKGEKVGKKTKVKLAVPMFSLDKKKPDTVDQWLRKLRTPNICLSDKLDGASLQLTYESGVPVQLVTRGDGKVGGDVSFLIPHIKNIPQKVGTKSFRVRCEGLFSHSAFNKYKAEFDAARNAASGILNRQDVHRSIKDLSIMVLQVLQPNMVPSKGLTWAKSQGFTVVPFKSVPTIKLNSKVLTTLLEKRRKVSKYAMDGLVLTEDKMNPIPMAGNPDYAIAFKLNVTADQAPTTIVRDVEWEISDRARIKPVIIYDPVNWDGSKLTRASAFNAKYVQENGIGVGAKVSILRSGDIIPYIVKVIKPARTPSQPDRSVVGEYTWDKSGTDYVLSKPTQNEDFRVKQISRFFTRIGVDFLREQTVRKLHASGFVNIQKIVSAKPKDFLQVPGVKIATADRIYDNIHKVLDAGVPLITLMEASGVFPVGMGATRLEKIARRFDLLKLCKADPQEQLESIMSVPGFKATTAQMFITGAPKFLKWQNLVGIASVEPKPVKAIKLASKKLAGLGVTWTGYRDKEQEQIVQQNGGSVVSFGGSTKVLLVSPTGKASTKADKAAAKGIPVMTWDKFARKYGL